MNVQLVGWDVQYQRITNAAISGEAPDVTQAGTTQVPVLRGARRLREPREPHGHDRRPQGVRTRVSGRRRSSPAGRGVWSVPWFTEARTIYYRKDVYKRAGVNPKTAFKNWASFRAALSS